MAKKTKLNTTVHVLADDGETHVFGPNDDLPDWAQEKITWPTGREDLWEGAERAPQDTAVENPGADLKDGESAKEAQEINARGREAAKSGK